MGRYRLLAGVHIQADKSQSPTKTKNPATGEVVETYPTRTFARGQVVESDTDLSAVHGADKFECLDRAGDADRVRDLERQLRDAQAELAQARSDAAYGGLRTPGDPTPLVASQSPAVAPGGQVSTGFQCTSGGVSGPMSPEDAARLSDRGEGKQDGGLFADRAAAKGGSGSEDDGLKSMTVAELREYAASEEIELHGAHKKDDLVAAIRKSGRAK